jgi:integrase
MARAVRNAKIDTRPARSRLAERREPYWSVIAKGCAVGYRKGRKGGSWIARWRDPEGRQHYDAMGPADDAMDADGHSVLSFGQAQERARQWFATKEREAASDVAPTGSYTVQDALADYLADYVRRGGKAANRMRYVIDAHILPALGDVEVTKLTRRRIEAWQDHIATTPPRLRTRKGAPARHAEADDSPEAVRRRRATANRTLTILKAALNHALHHRRVAGSDAWQAVKPYREADAPKIRYLTDDECRRLVNTCSADLRALVRAALLTGCRYGELTALTARDFNGDGGTIRIGRSKSGKPRHVALTDEGQQFFAAATAGKAASDPVFLRATGGRWKHADPARPLRAACEAARIEPAIGFHVLRHTYGSRLAMRGVPMGVIAAQLGHADTRMTERHYAHLAPSHIADTVRAALGEMGIVEPSGVIPLRRAGA